MEGFTDSQLKNIGHLAVLLNQLVIESRRIHPTLLECERFLNEKFGIERTDAQTAVMCVVGAWNCDVEAANIIKQAIDIIESRNKFRGK